MFEFYLGNPGRQIVIDEIRRQGMTQMALQKMTGILQHRISDYLTGKRDVNGETLRKRHCLPKDTIELTEVEIVPFTQYSKSTAFTFLQMAVSLAFGSHGVTMNLFDHSGTPMETEPAFGDMLRRKKPFLHALARRAQPPGSYRGVGVLFDGRAAYYKRLSPGADIQDLAADGPPTVAALKILRAAELQLSLTHAYVKS